ncbi:MAG: polysaccharide deacetylase family protein [Rhodospirillales bacterium]|nr:polysaccharide deacetylase family protein [Rhodospirillales bacterium]
MNNKIFHVLAALAFSFGSLLQAPQAQAQDAEDALANSAVVLMYHRFGDDRFPSTNIRLEQFQNHLSELANDKYNILALKDIIARQERGETLPDRAIGITMDDGYATIYDVAWPLLKKAGFPFTVFISTDAIDRGLADMMSWDQLREMAASGVTIAAHTGSHLHMPKHSITRTSDEIIRSARRLEEELGTKPTLFAYPYGEVSLAIKRQVAKAGFMAAFGQHSGAFAPSDDRFYLPRFSLNERFGDMGRFITASNALPLPLNDITPEDVYLGRIEGAANNPPAMGFTLAQAMPRIDELGCFLSHEGKGVIQSIGDVRFEVRVETPFPKGRTRLNCTLPGSGKNAGRWHWFGQIYYLSD